MKKATLTTLILILLIINGFSQENEQVKSKMLEFTSKTGVIIKFEDYDLPNIKSPYGAAQSKIRKIISGDVFQYFFQISKKGEYSTNTASIAYEDILEIQKALTTLKEQSDIDLISSSDYLENKFISDDGFRIGYYIKNGKIQWYMNLEEYASGDTVFAKEFELLSEAFRIGKEKIEELRNN